MAEATPVYFNDLQLEFKPMYEWAFGEKIDHPETTARAESILKAVKKEPTLFSLREPPEIPLRSLQAIHSYALFTLYNTATEMDPKETFYPSVFPKEKQGKGDPTNLKQAGSWCFDSGTPLNAKTYSAATWSAACAHHAARDLRKSGHKLTYSLSRPPGHHAQKDLFGGYCYFNNAAIAARHLRRHGRVAVVDIDFHHGNGTQSIFIRDPKVLVINLHGDPVDNFPFFAGYATEIGAGPGLGFNINLPLPNGTTGKKYVSTLKRHVLPALAHFLPEYLVISAGLDTYKKDPMGTFELESEDFETVGELFGRLHLPTVVVQEGGYYTPHLGKNAVALLRGFRQGLGKRRYVFSS